MEEAYLSAYETGEIDLNELRADRIVRQTDIQKNQVRVNTIFSFKKIQGILLGLWDCIYVRESKLCPDPCNRPSACRIDNADSSSPCRSFVSEEVKSEVKSYFLADGSNEYIETFITNALVIFARIFIIFSFTLMLI